MRKIETQMNQAVSKDANWSSANTTVTSEEGVSKVYLHGNHIATVGEDSLQLFDGGWQSVTTKSRLNALCAAFAFDGEGVFQKAGEWFVRRMVGAVNGQQVFKVVPFESGIILD